MECASRNILVIIIGYFTVTVTECQKSQLLVLSETRKTGLEGTLLQVNCTAHVTTVDSLKWIPGHDDQSDIQQTYLTNTTVVMTIPSLRGSDAGRYKCLLEMADGREEIAEFELMVRRKENNYAACSITQFKCRRTKHCIFLRYHCDGKDDCGDGSDEDCESNPCLNKFRCNNTRCVDNQDVCNHIDNCGDLSDEGPSCSLSKFMSTTQASLEDSQFGWLKITMSTVIASTVGVVILISFIVIVVFRVKMKRLREQRIARALESMYRHGDSGEATSSGQGDEAASDQHPFLPSGSHRYGNIIVNVNNGVQYLPGYDYSLFVATPPPYSECCGGDNRDPKSQPPPYSTIDRHNIHHHTCVTGHTDNHPVRQNISISSVQSCLGNMRCPDQTGAVLQANIDRNCCTGSVCQGAAQSQDLSGITSSFLQSLLGSHSESVSANGDRNTQSSPEASEGWSGRSFVSTRHKMRAGSESPSKKSVCSDMSSNKSRSRPNSDTTINSTQTSQQNCVTSNHVISAAEHRQDTIINGSIDSASHITSLQAQHPNTHALRTSFNSSAIPDMSIIVHQIPVGGADTCPAVSSAHRLDHSSCLLQSAHKLSGYDVALLGGSQAGACVSSVEDGTCLIRGRIHKPTNFDGDCDILPPCRTDTSNNDILPPCRTDTSSNNILPPCKTDTSNNDILPPCKTDTSNNDILPPCKTDTSSYDILLPCRIDTSTTSCNVLFSEKNKCRPGHLSVQKGQIVLHTDEGILVGDSNSSDHRQEMDRVRHEVSHACHLHEDCTPISVFTVGNPMNGGQDTESLTNLRQSENIGDDVNCSPSINQSGPDNNTRFSGELNVKDGYLVLETPKQTPASQILTHLQEAYEAEQRGIAEESVEPVINTKRPTGVVTRPPLPKFNSDFVMPYRKL